MAQATVVWHLSRRFVQSRTPPARRLIDVYESYRWLETKPLLDIMRVAFVPHLVAVQEWQEQTCRQCAIQYLLPTGSVGNTCWGCRLYLRHRCRYCDTPLTVRPKGRHREVCSTCRRARHHRVAGTWR